MIKLLTSLISDKSKVLILGYGKEGKSTYGFIRKYFPELQLGIADSNTNVAGGSEFLNDHKLEIIAGINYLDSLNYFDLIIKSPGVKLANISNEISAKITSQTDLFLQCYAKQVIGVTGTKGKSTTASLIKHFLDSDNKKALLLGNIGVPAFDMIDAIEDKTVVVYELSAHQLEYLKKSPHIAVLLNVFPEHLDYFNSFDDYQKAKFNICKFQNKDDYLIINESVDLPESTGPGRVVYEKRNQESGVRNQESASSLQPPAPSIQHLAPSIQYPAPSIQPPASSIIKIPAKGTKLKIENPPLIGDHNLINIETALYAASAVGVDRDKAISSLKNFSGLPHRLEYIGEFGGIKFVNDSISTVPESTIAAVKALEKVDTLILGGFDRGLDYTGLVEFLTTLAISNFIFLGKAGDRMFDIFKKNNDKKLLKAESIERAFEIIVDLTTKGSICLLSPAAASYDQFHNFEHRGDVFRELAIKL